MAEGRLDADEFEERLTAALTAKTQADLIPLFADLPSPKPEPVTPRPSPYLQQPLAVRAVAARPPYPVRIQSRRNTALATSAALIWPAMIVLMILSHGHFLFLMFIPFLLPWLLGRGRHDNYRRR
jgi:hypothetical protein